MSTLKRYWFVFERSSKPTILNAGCGVTAYSYDDAICILRERLFDGVSPTILESQENIDISTLDQKHVIPNMGSILARGIWFPLGYNER